MNVAVLQEKDEKTGKRKAEERIQATDFKEAACCPFVVVQRIARRKNGLCEGSARSNWDHREGQQPLFA